MTNQKTIDALSEALTDEYKARATYRKVIERFGPVQPFVNVVEAEGRHIAALLAQFTRLHANPPPDTWQDRVKDPASVTEACADAVTAEIDNDAMYARLLDQVDDEQVRSVMQQLREASRSKHLQAFQRCLKRGSGGHGRGRGAPTHSF